MKKGFNLLRTQLSPPTAWDKIYKWMVGTARIIIIAVEILVIVAFAIRIVIDTVGKNLDDQIEDLDNQLEAYSFLEEEFITIQTKTNTYQSLWEQSSNTNEVLTYARELLNAYSGTLSLRLNDDTLSLSGELIIADIKVIEDNMKSRVIDEGSSNPLFSLVSLDNLDDEGKSEQELATFSITADIIQKDIKRELRTADGAEN